MSKLDRDTVINALVQTIPYVGSPIATLYFGHKDVRRFERLETFYSEIGLEIESFKEKLASIDNFDAAEFRAILEEMNTQIESEQALSKRELYKTYFKSTLVSPVKDNFDRRKLYLDILKTLTPLMIKIFNLLVKHKKPIKTSHVVLSGIEPALVFGSIKQLVIHGLFNSQLDSISFGSNGGQMDEIISVSEFGMQFHEFCIHGIHH